VDRLNLKLACGLGLLAAAGAAALWPHWTLVRDLRAQREELGRRAAVSDDGAAAVRRLEAELSRVQALAASVVTPIPEESDVASLIRKLSARLDGLGVAEREITTGASVNEDDVSSMPMSVRIGGSFESVYSAVRWIEELPRLVRVQRVKLETAKAGDKGDAQATAGLVKAELLIDVFFAPHAPETAGTGAPIAPAPLSGGRR
jgi:Tfp pilus assembly protein PilO